MCSKVLWEKLIEITASPSYMGLSILRCLIEVLGVALENPTLEKRLTVRTTS